MHILPPYNESLDSTVLKSSIKAKDPRFQMKHAHYVLCSRKVHSVNRNEKEFDPSQADSFSVFQNSLYRGKTLKLIRKKSRNQAQTSLHHIPPSEMMSQVSPCLRQWTVSPTGLLESRIPHLDWLGHLSQPTYQAGALTGIYWNQDLRLGFWTKFTSPQEKGQGSKEIAHVTSLSN